MRKCVAIVQSDKIIIQEAEYIEDGFYIEIIGDKITLFEIPQFGGNAIRIAEFDTLMEALDYSEKLT